MKPKASFNGQCHRRAAPALVSRQRPRVCWDWRPRAPVPRRWPVGADRCDWVTGSWALLSLVDVGERLGELVALPADLPEACRVGRAHPSYYRPTLRFPDRQPQLQRGHSQCGHGR